MCRGGIYKSCRCVSSGSDLLPTHYSLETLCDILKSKIQVTTSAVFLFAAALHLGAILQAEFGHLCLYVRSLCVSVFWSSDFSSVWMKCCRRTTVLYAAAPAHLVFPWRAFGTRAALVDRPDSDGASALQ